MTETYDSQRFYSTSIKFLTRYMEEVPPAEADPKVVSEIVKALLGLNITPADFASLDDQDPAKIQAMKFAAAKKKPA